MGVAALVLIWLLYPKDFDYTGGIADNVTYFKVSLPHAASLCTSAICAGFCLQLAALLATVRSTALS